MRKFNIIILTIIYVFAVGIITLIPASSNLISLQNFKHQAVFTTPSQISCHTANSDIFVNYFGNSNGPILKQEWDEYIAKNIIFELVSKAKYGQYICFSRCFYRKFLSIDIIFPFHNFW